MYLTLSGVLFYPYLVNLTNSTTIKLIPTSLDEIMSSALYLGLDYKSQNIRLFTKNEQGDPPLAEIIINNVQTNESNSSFSEYFLTVSNRELVTFSSRAITTSCSRVVKSKHLNRTKISVALNEV